MTPLLIAIVVVVFAAVCLYDPKLYRKLLAPVCSLREDDFPEFPRTAALALLVFFGFVVLAPALLKAVGSHIWLSQRWLDWLVAISFLAVGLGLLVSPRACLQMLRWPHSTVPNATLVSRIVGALLLVGCALFAKSQILHW